MTSLERNGKTGSPVHQRFLKSGHTPETFEVRKKSRCLTQPPLNSDWYQKNKCKDATGVLCAATACRHPAITSVPFHSKSRVAQARNAVNMSGEPEAEICRKSRKQSHPHLIPAKIQSQRTGVSHGGWRVVTICKTNASEADSAIIQGMKPYEKPRSVHWCQLIRLEVGPLSNINH